MEGQINNNTSLDDEIDLVELLKQIWSGRKIILYSAIVGGLMGLIIALLSPNSYSASSFN